MELGLGFLFGVILACMGMTVLRWWRIETFSEDSLMAELVRQRSDRYIAAVAKTTIEQEVEKSARDQVAKRLSAHGVVPHAQ